MDELQEKRLQAQIKNEQLDDQFESQLNTTLNIDVEESLADRILLNQRTNISKPFLSAKHYFSIAASLTLVLFLFGKSTPALLSEVALEHVYHELDHLVDTNTIVDINVLKESINTLGFSLKYLPKDIIYAGECVIGDKKGIHIVAKINNNPVTIFLSGEKTSSENTFQDNRFTGGVYPKPYGSMILVGESSIDIKDILVQTKSG